MGFALEIELYDTVTQLPPIHPGTLLPRCEESFNWINGNDHSALVSYRMIKQNNKENTFQLVRTEVTEAEKLGVYPYFLLINFHYSSS